MNGVLLVALSVLSCCVVVARAFGDGEESGEYPSRPHSDAAAAIEAGTSTSGLPQLTNPAEADGVRLNGLQRSEAMELLNNVFEVPVEGAAGIFDELQNATLLTSHVAVVPDNEAESGGTSSGDEPQGSTVASEVEATPDPEGRRTAPAELSGAGLVHSTAPLEVAAGQVVDLSLERAGSQLKPVAPLVEARIPASLDEAIQLPEAGISIKVAGVDEERAASVSGDSVAFYPNVSEDSDLVISPTPTGVETMTQLRTSDAPRTETFKLTLPPAATLMETTDGGAEVRAEEKLLMSVPAPTAIDASGESVPVDLDVTGDRLQVRVDPSPQVDYPVLVDPLFQVYEWSAKGNDLGICSNSFQPESFNACNQREEWGYDQHLYPWTGGVHMQIQHLPNQRGINIHAGGEQKAGDYSSVIYTVPRYFKESPAPRSFIKSLRLSDVDWEALGPNPSPYLFMGIWAENIGWLSSFSHTGQIGHGIHDHTYAYVFNNPGNIAAKQATVAIYATEATAGSNASVHVGAATVELGDSEAPQQPVPTAQTNWVNKGATPVGFSAGDAGLGVYAVSASTEKVNSQGVPLYTWKARHGCIGVGDSACPVIWKSSEPGHPALTYDPSVLPTGLNYLALVAEDPVGNRSSSSWVQVKVDHTAPEIAPLSGSLTETATLGTKQSTYTLKINATDGSTEKPQSGVAKTVVKLDGNIVDETNPGCATKNCAISHEWILDSNKYGAGQHTVEVTATDAVGITSLPRTLTFKLHPVPPPSLDLTGTVTEQAAIGVTRPRYNLELSATATGEPAEAAPPNALRYLGSGQGQFSDPADVVVDPKGNVWVADAEASRISQFTADGEPVREFYVEGYPSAIDVDINGNVWMTDTYNDRVLKFSEDGELERQLGSSGSAEGQFNGPVAIEADGDGRVWVADSGNNRIVELREVEGEYVAETFANGPGNLNPADIAIDPSNNVWVADSYGNRVVTFDDEGSLTRQFGFESTGEGQLELDHRASIEVDPKGNVWLADPEQSRVVEFTEEGEYLTQFGSEPSGLSQLSLSSPSGVAIDSNGRIFVADGGAVQAWQIQGYLPSHTPIYSQTFDGGPWGQFGHLADMAVSPHGALWVVDEGHNAIKKFYENGGWGGQFGTQGSGNGQFKRPSGIAVDAKGNIWVSDTGNNRIQKFNDKGEYLSKFGSGGSGSGQLSHPKGIAIDGKGNVWIADTYNGRIQEFNEKGEFVRQIRSFGSEEHLCQPTGIAVGPGGNVWVADLCNRIVGFEEDGDFIRQFGSQGTGDGQFNGSAAIAVDSGGHIWVGDQGNNRIQKFTEEGEYIDQFGSHGSGIGEFWLEPNYYWYQSVSMGLALTANDDIWITDTENRRLQKWLQPKHADSTVTADVTVDGKPVDSTEAACETETCSLERSWSLDSSSHAAGPHTLVVKATDIFGNITTRSMPIEIQRDTTKPALEVGGELFHAPEGWVEEETYGFNATASDAGYGVTSLTLTIDGQQVASVSHSCSDGGCDRSLSKQINMAGYSGGSHSAEIVATDGAGNSAARKWTVNVDPDGHITAAEAEATLSAVDTTASSSVVAPSDEVLAPQQIEGGNNPGWALDEGEIRSTGVPNETTMTTDPADGFTIDSPEGEATITPVMSGSSSSVSIAEDVAGIAPNTASGVDSVIRPEYNGVLTFQAIRSEASPTEYSWRVHLAEGQILRLANPTQVEVLYDDGHLAYLITSEGAHDAVGTPVPTLFSVSGDVLTLTVGFHSGNFIYPIVAGQGWEGSYNVPVVIDGPEDELEVIEREQLEREREREGEEPTPPPPASGVFTVAEAQQVIASKGVGPEIIPAPEPSASGGASASSVPEKVVRPYKRCSDLGCGVWWVEIRNPSYRYRKTVNGRSTAYWQDGTQVHGESWRAPQYFPALQVGLCGAGFVEPYQVWAGEQKHLTTWLRSEITATAFVYTGDTFDEINRLAMQIWVWPNGFQQRWRGHWAVTQEWQENSERCLDIVEN